MPLETGSFINDLTTTNPISSDPVGQGDDHLRLIKATVQGSLPNFGAILGQVRRQDTALSISSTWNTNHFICSASATATVVLTLPPAASITTGFYVDITTIGTGTVSLLPSGAASINGSTSLSIPRLNTARAYFVTGTGWLADVVPHGNGGYVVGGNLTVEGALSVSGAVTHGATLNVRGATTLDSTLSVSGAATFKSAVSISGAAVVGGALTVAGNCTISGSLVLLSGQIKFPATQNASADANTLDDYEEGTWTPTLTFSTPGNVSVAYSIRTANYTKIGRDVRAHFDITTSTFTHTTASGNLQVSGYPFTTGAIARGAIVFDGMKAVLSPNFCGCTLSMAAGATVSAITASGINDNSAVNFTETNHTSGVNVVVSATINYII